MEHIKSMGEKTGMSDIHTVKPANISHSRDKEKVAFIDRWPLFTGGGIL